LAFVSHPPQLLSQVSVKLKLVYANRRKTISRQIEVLNESFDLAEISWELVDVTRTIKEEWFTNVIADNEE
jgi:hypothetical protein